MSRGGDASRVTLLVLVLLVLAGAACGSGAVQGPADPGPADTVASESTTTEPTTSGTRPTSSLPPTTPPNTGTTRPPTSVGRPPTSGTLPPTSATSPSTTVDDDDEWGWGLPEGDVSPAEFERSVYKELRNSCVAGQAELDRKWKQLLSPVTVLLFQAGVYVCAGDRGRGRQMFELAASKGLTGISTYETVCKVYKAVRSVLEQIDPDTVTCPDGRLPPWPTDKERDDPRTLQDESATTTTTSTSTTSSTVRSATETAPRTMTRVD